MTPDAPFILDRIDNPHPRMLAKALRYRSHARGAREGMDSLTRWRSYLECMADATGCTTDEIEAWMDSHAVPGDRVRTEST